MSDNENKLQEQMKSPQPATVVSGPTTIVQETQAIVKQTADIDGFIQRRREFIQKVSAICVEGKDYHVIQGKKSLAKGGAEKIASIFQWNAKFDKDSETLEMLGGTQGLVAFKCTLAKGIKYVGEGRGAAMLSKNAGDPNKTIKMAQKSAFIDAVLRASGLSDFFTQDLEDMEPSHVTNNSQSTVAPSDKQLDLIGSLMEQKRLEEADIIDNGFTAIKDLTGGKEGTASELIAFLLAYVPPKPITITQHGQLLLNDLRECNSIESYNKIKAEIEIAKANGKLKNDDWEQITRAAKSAVERLQRA